MTIVESIKLRAKSIAHKHWTLVYKVISHRENNSDTAMQAYFQKKIIKRSVVMKTDLSLLD